MLLELETKRLILKPFNKEDSMRITELANDKELATILGLPYPYRLEHAQEWIAIQPEQIQKGEEYPLTIVSKREGIIVGTITLRIDKSNDKGELGYWVGREYWGSGIATEAIQRMIEFGFSQLELNKIWAAVLSENKASGAVLKKVGLQKEGHFKQDRFAQGEYKDLDLFGLLKCEHG
ncbi:GNAT family N-acetyltransferase [Halobacillus salinus]|uniref:N-acetyltransferase n=1 Tax=Halobacillus salinus TaxID=192814 RepID=A0A4Z0H372_9BACI|nr:GNAT family protein [Halobacillus salinus]TGB03625.1 N-acetyltransferase [Halobacillus salinus]